MQKKIHRQGKKVDMPQDYRTIAEAAEMLRTRALSPVELIDDALARIHQSEHLLNSIVKLDESTVRRDAQMAESEIAAGQWRGPLHGVPVGIKDVFDVSGLPTTGCSAQFRTHVASQDATAVRHLRAAGAIIAGKLTTWECAVGGTSFDLPWPPARNPWNLDHDPGGSSSGSGAAVAAGFCLGATGSDTGGSIREPAAWCGLAGLKPTYNLVDRQGVMPASFSLDHAGPLCWTSRDAALMLEAMTGGAFSKPSGTPDPFEAKTLAGVQVGLVDLSGESKLHLEPDVHSALSDVVRLLKDAGASVRPVRIAALEVYSAVCTIISAAEGYLIHEHTLRTSPELYDGLTRQRLLAGKSVTASDYMCALQERKRLAAEMKQLMRSADVLLMPTSRETAPLLGEFDSHAGHPSLTRPWNVTGFPALSVCCGFSGMPLAVQLIGRPFADIQLLGIGHLIERATGSRHRRPALRRSDGAAPPRNAARKSDREVLQANISTLQVSADIIRSRSRFDAEDAGDLRFDLERP